MPAPTCYEQIQLVAVRATRLTASGALLTGAQNAYQSAAPIQIEHGFEYANGADVTQRNGQGQICLRYRGEDKLQSVTVAMNLCQLDFQFLELLTSWPALVDGSATPAVIGLSSPALSAANRNGVCLEGWSLAWDGDQQAVNGASAPLYVRHVWPRVKLNVGNFTIEEGALVVPVSGQGFGNSVLATARGPAGDWPVGIQGPWASFLDPSIVVPICQYLTAPTGS
jgi:hypothetical protein